MNGNWCVKHGSTNSETFLVVSYDGRRSAGVTEVCIDCLRKSVIIGEVKLPEEMASYRRYAEDWHLERRHA